MLFCIGQQADGVSDRAFSFPLITNYRDKVWIEWDGIVEPDFTKRSILFPLDANGRHELGLVVLNTNYRHGIK